MRIARRSAAAGLALVAVLLLAGSAARTRAAAVVGPERRRDPVDGTDRRHHHLRRAPGPEALDDQGARHERERRQHAGPTTAVGRRSAEAHGRRCRLWAAGVYTVAWRTVSAVDGHLATGSFAFGVGVAPVAGGAGATAGQGTAGGGDRAVGRRDRRSVAAVRRPRRPARRWHVRARHRAARGRRCTGASCRSPGSWPPRHRHRDRGRARRFGRVARPDRGHVVRPRHLLRGVPLLVAGIGVVLAPPQRRARPRSRSSRSAPRGLLADVLLSHAAAGASGPRRRRGPGAPRHRRRPVARRARRAARHASGGTAGRAHRPRGQAVLVARHDRHRDRRGHRPAPGDRRGRDDRRAPDDRFRPARHRQDGAARRARRARRDQPLPERPGRRPDARPAFAGSVRSSCSSAATVLLLAASLVNLAPPAEVAAAGCGSIAEPDTGARSSSSGNDFGTSVRSELVVSPGTAGFNTFTATVTDYDTGAPVAATASPCASLPGPVRRRELAARPRADGRRASSRRPATTSRSTGRGRSRRPWPTARRRSRCRSSSRPGPRRRPAAPSPTIDVNAVAGLPTIYTVHLSAGRTVQVYLDPGQAGRRTRST